MDHPGSAAAAAQAGIGNVVAGSAFAVLQSAGAGGAGLAIVNAVVGTSAAAIAVGTTAPAVAKAVREDQAAMQEEKDEELQDKEKKTEN